jgi:hypothetical protein
MLPWPESSWSVFGIFGLLRSKFWILSVGGRSFLFACVNVIHSGYVWWLSISCYSLPSVYMRPAARIAAAALRAGTRGPQTPPEERQWPLLAYVAVQNVAEPCPLLFGIATWISTFLWSQYLIHIVGIYSNFIIVYFHQRITNRPFTTVWQKIKPLKE